VTKNLINNIGGFFDCLSKCFGVQLYLVTKLSNVEFNTHNYFYRSFTLCDQQGITIHIEYETRCYIIC
jgi:hypothetical protein